MRVGAVLLFALGLVGIGVAPASAAVQVAPYAGVSYNTVDMESLNESIEFVNEWYGTSIPTIDNAIGFVGGLRISSGEALSTNLEIEHLAFESSYSSMGSSIEFSGGSTGVGALARYALEGGPLSIYGGPIYHWGGLTIREEYDYTAEEYEYTGSGFGFKVGAELLHTLGSQLSLLARAGYRSLDYDVESEEFASGGETAGLSGFELSAGLSFGF